MAAESAGSEESGRPAKRTKFDYLEGLIVVVGEEETRFALHEPVACESSDFFRAAFQGRGDWKESAEKIVRLPEIDKNIFAIYVGFLYTGNIDWRIERSVSLDDKTIQALSLDDRSQILDRAIHAYALGEMLQDPSFRNAIIDKTNALMGMTGRVGSPSNIVTLCEKVSRSSKMMRFFVDSVATSSFEKHDINEWFNKLPNDFVFDLACTSVVETKLTHRQRWPANRLCFYHDHETAAEKCK